MESIPTTSEQSSAAAERFWSKVDKSGANGCWLWLGSISTTGYGGVTWNGQDTQAHRVSYLLTHGEFPPAGSHTDHLCRVPSCVNPAHLEAVSPSTNFIRGEHPNAIIHRTNICKRGHELTPENSEYRKNGTRNCRECARRRTNEGRARRKRERGYR